MRKFLEFGEDFRMHIRMTVSVPVRVGLEFFNASGRLYVTSTAAFAPLGVEPLPLFRKRPPRR